MTGTSSTMTKSPVGALSKTGKCAMLRCWKSWERVASGLCNAGCRPCSSALFSTCSLSCSPSISCLFSFPFSRTDSVTMIAGCWRICSKMKSGKSDKSVGSILWAISTLSSADRTVVLLSSALSAYDEAVCPCCPWSWRAVAMTEFSTMGVDTFSVVTWATSVCCSGASKAVCASLSWCKRAFWRNTISS